MSSLEDINAFIDTFQKHGHQEVDSARVYGGGSTEESLAAAKWQERGLVMETKLYPTKGKGMEWLTPEIWSHEPKDVRAGLVSSLKALQADKIDMFYLHGPDRNTPFEDTLREVNQLHKEGYFQRFGISNFQSWEVAQLCEICERNGWIKPTVYQGLYNAFQRSVEAELIPCLRHYGIGLYAFQPLAGGFLTSKYQRDQKQYEAGSRFDPSQSQGKLHHSRYMNDRSFDALEILRPVAKRHGLTEAECGLRWLAHHSALKEELHDAIIIGASSTAQLEQNLVDLEKGPLPEEIVQALNDGWSHHISGTYKYWH